MNNNLRTSDRLKFAVVAFKSHAQYTARNRRFVNNNNNIIYYDVSIIFVRWLYYNPGTRFKIPSVGGYEVFIIFSLFPIYSYLSSAT